ncbi:MAG: galactokinase [Candidatus Auribacterota bacterium]|nr:galactokinase [Candidatus Auribacterota bacterium]
MIITRTPFRVTLGGGGTDLSSYYSKYGGFIFAAGIAKYMYIDVNQPFDGLVRVKYSRSETVKEVEDIDHDIAREALKMMGVERGIEVVSIADIPAGTGLGSSSCYTVGILNAIHTYKLDHIGLSDLAEEACKLEIDILGAPIGKQDQYMAAFGGFTVLEIAKDGVVKVRNARISEDSVDELNRNMLMFYTHTSHRSSDILEGQSRGIEKNEKEIVDSMHRIKEIGYQILEAMESSNLSRVGMLFDEHWEQKKKLSTRMTNPRFDEIYNLAINNGALGGKISGAGGGGFFVFYVENDHRKFKDLMKGAGLRPMRYRFDFEGSKVLVNFRDASF